jgi:2'-5' RNA ligase
MRIIAEPKQRNFSHITVKGPYRTRQKKQLSKDNELIHGEEMKIIGAGKFFINNQNTVFLKCEEKKELYEIWKTKEEKTYKEFHPHITIYDGDNRQFAKELYNTISSYKINFSFKIEKLELYSSADKTNLFDLKSQVYKTISNIFGNTVNESIIDNLTDIERISAISKLCYILEQTNDLENTKVSTRVLKDSGLLVEA